MTHDQKDPNAKLLKSYLPPFKGTWSTLPSYLLPEDTLQDSLNVTLLSGRLRSRCGLQLFNNTSLDSPIVGSFLTVDTTRNKYPIVASQERVYRYASGVYTDITSNITLSSSEAARMTSLQLGTQVYILFTNGIENLKIIPESTYLLSNITPFSGSIPTCTDICTSFSRFVGITPPYTLQWCDVINDSYLSFTNWPALNQVVLADTEDALVCISALGTTGLAVYKEGNIFVGFPQSGPNSSAFRFEHKGEYEGPAGVNARVKVNGTDIYMTPTGRIGAFDGIQHSWLCDGIWPRLQDLIDPEFIHNAFGVYHYKTAEVTFFFPRTGDSGECKGLLTINLPFPMAGVTTYAYFLGSLDFPCTNGLSVRLFNTLTSPLIFGNDNQTFILDKNTYTDNSTAFTCYFRNPLFRPPQEDITMPGQITSDIYRPTLEVYATRSRDRGVVEVSALTSNNLENDGNSTLPELIDLSETPINEYIPFNDTGSFLGVEFTWQSDSKFEYKGCDIYGRSTT